jgi:hypothetical protein
MSYDDSHTKNSLKFMHAKLGQLFEIEITSAGSKTKILEIRWRHSGDI